MGSSTAATTTKWPAPPPSARAPVSTREDDRGSGPSGGTGITTCRTAAVPKGVTVSSKPRGSRQLRWGRDRGEAPRRVRRSRREVSGMPLSLLPRDAAGRRTRDTPRRMGSRGRAPQRQQAARGAARKGAVQSRRRPDTPRTPSPSAAASSPTEPPPPRRGRAGRTSAAGSLYGAANAPFPAILLPVFLRRAIATDPRRQ